MNETGFSPEAPDCSRRGLPAANSRLERVFEIPLQARELQPASVEIFAGKRLKLSFPMET